MPATQIRSDRAPLFLVSTIRPDNHDSSKNLFEEILERRRLTAVFQPIIDFGNHAYIAFEGLIRGPADTPLQMPKALFETAERIGCRRQLEQACRETIFRAFAQLQLPGLLFINSSPDCLDDDLLLDGGSSDLLHQIGIRPDRVVIELTENQRITDYPDIQQTLAHYRRQGFRIAIDDLGEGFANLRMWSEIRPDFVKIDRHFINGIAEDTLKHRFVQAMQSLAESCSAQIIAEGIEREADCLTVRDLGISLGQGYLIAVPTSMPRALPSEKIIGIVKQRRIAVFPPALAPSSHVAVRSLIRPVTPITPDTGNDDVFRRFDADPELVSMPVVADGTPLGLINRHELIDRLSRPYRRELFGRKSCAQFMDPLPLCIDEDAPIQDAAMTVSRSARRHIYDGFIITRNGRYAGIGSAHDLMGMITQMQIQAARYANPLTQLPGNVPINEHIDRLLARKIPFCACYVDIDHFKPFNDVYGYRRGDDVIGLLAQTLTGIAHPLADFCGHIGGDDFMVLFQSEDWEVRCRQALTRFDQQLAAQVEADSLTLVDGWRGYYAENRRGEHVFYPLPSVSIGAVPVLAERFESHHELSAAASEAKKHAKKTAGSSLFIERRHPAGNALKS
ncbi:GGDEF domain-containing protein [Propionivibrio dicarboxylicus]|uniref:Diguanylate cyclase/phosphodiesterase n=1 Tax=Propionivibrio dicarboxylicus TaxID=83767 RepID=A0A1G8G6P1_9RHOO|nr:GGDEF domain-containing protein [Propionivibrio dicarboxylicus]SDH90064.1 diguanylate cyclase/phosphodiesterase [Propionivibrio dicarboxylicus]